MTAAPTYTLEQARESRTAALAARNKAWERQRQAEEAAPLGGSTAALRKARLAVQDAEHALELAETQIEVATVAAETQRQALYAEAVERLLALVPQYERAKDAALAAAERERTTAAVDAAVEAYDLAYALRGDIAVATRAPRTSARTYRIRRLLGFELERLSQRLNRSPFSAKPVLLKPWTALLEQALANQPENGGVQCNA